MRFAREPYSANLVAEMRPLWDQHEQEIPQLGLGLNPDLIAYRAMAEAGALRIYTARLGSENDTILVGYQIFFVARHPHRRNSLEATQDILYLDPEVRKGMVGIKFIRWCDEHLKAGGVRVIHHPIDARHDFGAIFKRMGYELADVVYSKRVA